MLEFLRRKVFWSLDFLKGGGFKKNYNDVKFINENFSSENSINKRNQYLGDVLNHAIKTTQFYSKYSINTPLDRFPVVNKNTIRDNFKDFQSSQFKQKKNYQASTSGSTGTPFTTFFNKNKKTRNSVDTLYFAEQAGFELGNQLIYIRLWVEKLKRAKLIFWFQNIVSHNITNLSDEDIKELLNKLEKSNYSKGFLGYSSAFESVCQYLDSQNSPPLDYKVNSIISIAENLSDYAKESMQKYFGVPVLSRYSATEVGIIAQQSVRSSNFDINWASYFIEILKIDDDTPTELGELGRIVITDLFNYAVPMIRYDIGDLGAMEVLKKDSAPVLITIEGRQLDVLYNTMGALVSSHIIHQIFLVKGIRQYQLIQNGEKNYTFKISVSSEYSGEEEIRNVYSEYLGSDAIINFQYVDDIPLLSSGKRKKVVNLYKN